MFVITSATSPLGRRVFAKFNQLGAMTAAMLNTCDANTFPTYESAAHVLRWSWDRPNTLRNLPCYTWHVEEVR